MKDNFCPSSKLYETDYSTPQIETGVYQIEFDKPESNPFPEYKFFVRVGGGYRGFVSKKEARAYYRQD